MDISREDAKEELSKREIVPIDRFVYKSIDLLRQVLTEAGAG
jgi:hypothetical protein